MAKGVVTVDVDDPGVDIRNIRGGEGKADEELIQDIEDNGAEEGAGKAGEKVL